MLVSLWPLRLVSWYFLINQDKSHRLDVLVSIVSSKRNFVSTRVEVIVFPTRTKPDSGVTVWAKGFVVSKDTNSGFGMIPSPTHSVEPFLVTAGLQGSLGTNQCFPSVKTQWGVSVLLVSNQWVQGISVRIYHNKIKLLMDLHTEADFGEGCVPVGR